MLTSRQRVLNALSGGYIDRQPVDMFEGGSLYPALSRRRLLDYFGTSEWDTVLEESQSDIRWLDGAVYKGAERYTPDGSKTNEFGAIALQYEPLKDNLSINSIESFDWPDADDWDYSGLIKQAQRYAGYALCAPYVATPVFCRISELITMQNALMCMYTEPVLIEALVERISHYNYRFVENVLKTCGSEIDIFWTWDDVAMQTGMMFPPEKWRHFYKDSLKKLFELVKGYDLKIMYHCCGSPVEIIPDLIDIGVDVLSPVQTTANGMEPKKLKNEYGKHLCFHGGIDTQHLLPYGTAGQVRETVRRNIEDFGPGYIVASSHCLNDCIPVENIIAMFKETISCKYSKL